MPRCQLTVLLVAVIATLIACGAAQQTCASTNRAVFRLQPGAQIAVGPFAEASLSCAQPAVTVASAPTRGTLAASGTTAGSLVYSAAASEGTDVTTITLACGASTCNAQIGFFVSLSAPAAPTPAPTAAAPAPPSVPSAPATPAPAPTPAPGPALCPAFSASVQPDDQYVGFYDGGVAACVGGATRGLSVVQQPDDGAFIVTEGSNYIFASPTTSPVVSNVVVAVTCGTTTVCQATLTFTTGSANTPAPTPATPRCPSVNTVFAAVTNAQLVATFDPAINSCANPSARVVTQPAKGTLTFTSGLTFAFATDDDDAGQAFAEIDVSCSGAVSCRAALVFNIAIATPAPSVATPAPTPAPVMVSNCPVAQQVFTVAPYGQLSQNLDVGLTCTSASVTIRTDVTKGALIFPTGTRFLFVAPETPGQTVAVVEVACTTSAAGGATQRCLSQLGFFFAAPTPVPQTTTPATTSAPATPAPTALATPVPAATPSPATPAPPTPAPKPQCAPMPGSPYTFTVPVNTQFRQQLAAPAEITAACAAVVFRRPADAVDANQRFVSNIVGEFLYVSPSEETADAYAVDVMCLQTFVCQINVQFRVFAQVTLPPSLTPPPSPTPAPTPAPIAECPNIYYFYAVPGIPFSNTLRDRPGEPVCSAGRSFELLRPVSFGRLSTMTLRGDFVFETQVEEKFADFGFTMYCLGAVVCQGSAYIIVSKSVVAPPPPPGSTGNPWVPSTPAPATPAPPAFLNTDTMKCSGTCNTDAWKAMPQFPDVWDDTADENGAFSHVTPRADGKPLNGIDLRWDQGTLLLTAYGKVGNVAARFPTFERVDFIFGDRFTASELKSRIASSSTGFDQDCLANQPDFGMAEEVWKITSKENKTGRVGSRYASGASWYHKFGGKHINCDTFVKSCQYAPLLTPNRMRDAAGNQLAAKWQVEVSDCDVTWRGSFPYNALTQMKRRDGTPVWQYVGPRQLSATVFSEAVKPMNWLEPARGVATRVASYPLNFDLQEWARIDKNDEHNSPFTLDVQFFEYLDNATNDKAFGLNILVFPSVPEGSKTSYFADRHVRGFAWRQINWRAPTDSQCPTCTGTEFNCTAPDAGRGGLTADVFPGGNCGQRARVVLSKGQRMTRDDCPVENDMHVYDRAGFSPTLNCRASYQNLTIRGVAPGSRNAPSSFTFEGVVELQLLLDNGNMPRFNIDLSLFVSRLSTADLRGSLDICRASPYWPVYDPLGVSTPDRPHELSAATPGYVCIDRVDRDFGPTGWALITIDVEGVPAERVRVDSLSVTYPEALAPVVLVGPSLAPAASGLDSWKFTHPFFNFRDLRSRIVGNGTLAVSPDVAAIAPPDAAFMFTPGAIDVHTQMEITAVVSVLDAATQTTVVGQVTFKQYLMVDPLLTARSRFGPIVLAETIVGATLEDGNLFAMVVAAGVIVGVLATAIFYMAADNDRPLPKWVPRGKMLKKTLFKVVPIQGVLSLAKIGGRGSGSGGSAAKSVALPAELALAGSPYASAVRSAAVV